MDVYTVAARELLNLSEEKDRMLVEEEEAELNSIIERLMERRSKKSRKIEMLRRTGGMNLGPWYIEADSVAVEDTAPLHIEVTVRKSGSDAKKAIEDSSLPPFEDYKIDSVEEHSGEGYGQQSIVIAVTEVGGTGRTAEVQVEVDMATGDFDGDSLSSWEITEGDEEE